MKTVIIESPYAGNTVKNTEYARLAAKDCVKRGESPFASHLFYTQFLDDNNQTERKLGIDAGFAWWKHADLIAFYIDLGWSTGMKEAYEKCKSECKTFTIRSFDIANLNSLYR